MSVAMEAAATQIDGLIDLVHRLSLAATQAEITATVIGAIRRLVDADGATFVLKEGECCFYADEDAIGPLWKGERFPINTCVSGWAMRSRSTAVIADIRTDERIPQDAYRPTFVRSLVMAPVHTDTPIAAIGAYWARVKRASDQDVAMVEAIAHAAALALQNLQLVNSLKAAAETKARLLTAVGHDLRQPLQSLTLFASILGTDASTPSARTAAEQVNAAVDRIANLLGSILALAELDTGTVVVNRRDVAINDLLAPIATEMTPQAEAKGITLTRVPCSAAVRTDPDLMAAILRNLTANSIRYTQHGRILLGARRRGGLVDVVVADTGIGIEPGKQSVIFEEFYQVGNQGRDFTAGTGVGLAIVRRLVDILGHDIRVRSIEGRGSVFTVTLPTA